MSGLEVKKEDVEILAFCLKYLRNEEPTPKHQCIDQYVLDSMYCFTQSVTKLTLDLMVWQETFDVAFQKVTFYGLSKTSLKRILQVQEKHQDETNLIRRDLLCLFPNCIEVELWTSYDCPFAMNLEALLVVLEEAVFSPSFQRLRIRDSKGDWIVNKYGWTVKSIHPSIVTDDVVERYKAKNFRIKYEKTRVAHWIVNEPNLESWHLENCVVL